MTDHLRGSLEVTLLSVLAGAPDGVSGLDVRRLVAERTERTYAVGAIYTVLQRLEDKGFVTVRVDEPRAMRGGRARRLFSISRDGREALEAFRRHADLAWGRRPVALAPL